MKVKLLAFLLLLLSGTSCVTRPVVVLKETELKSQNDVEFWAEYGTRVMGFDDAERAEELEFLKQKQDDEGWRGQFKQALVLGLAPRGAKDLIKAQRLLKRLEDREDLDAESGLALEWYLLSFNRTQLLFEVANKNRQESTELKEKLRALSTIEKQIQERSDQIAR